MILVAYGSDLPLASLGLHDQNGAIAAVRALFEEVPLAGRVVTLDVLHTVRDPPGHWSTRTALTPC